MNKLIELMGEFEKPISQKVDEQVTEETTSHPFDDRERLMKILDNLVIPNQAPNHSSLADYGDWLKKVLADL